MSLLGNLKFSYSLRVVIMSILGGILGCVRIQNLLYLSPMYLDQQIQYWGVFRPSYLALFRLVIARRNSVVLLLVNLGYAHFDLLVFLTCPCWHILTCSIFLSVNLEQVQIWLQHGMLYSLGPLGQNSTNCSINQFIPLKGI